ncbi:MAG TPA: putative quinol monooxygenase [Phycisphaerae bacterium]|nr:putative quinol monooxygenase [Phycisphaerae bacterium]
MYVVAVTVYVKEAFVSPFVEATLDNARNTRREAGNVRFDVSQALDDPTRFLLYEVYRGADDFAAHQQTDHYLRWRGAVADWMAQPRQGVKHESVFFGDATAFPSGR